MAFLFFVYVQTDTGGLKDTDLFGNEKLGIPNCTAYSYKEDVATLTFDGLKNWVVQAAYQEALREINIKVLIRMHCEDSRVLDLQSIITCS